jgi:hypothetical protein
MAQSPPQLCPEPLSHSSSTCHVVNLPPTIQRQDRNFNKLQKRQDVMADTNLTEDEVLYDLLFDDDDDTTVGAVACVLHLMAEEDDSSDDDLQEKISKGTWGGSAKGKMAA